MSAVACLAGLVTGPIRHATAVLRCLAAPPPAPCTAQHARRLCARGRSVLGHATAQRPLTRQCRCASNEAPGTTKCNNACTIIGVPGDAAQDFTDALLTYGALAAWIQEAVPEGGEEEPIFADPVPGEGRAWLGAVWFNCKIVALFEANSTREGMQEAVADSAGTAGVDVALELTWSEVYDEDWEAQIKASYVPLQLTDDLWIIPEWCEPPEPEKTNLILKPGIAFGTGEHPTTRLCLRWLQGAGLSGCTVLDYGCGSGILSVAACLYGAKHVVALDVDPLAVRATQTNAQLNACDTRCEVYAADPFMEDPDPLRENSASMRAGFDVCVANILKPALLDLRPRLTGYVRPGGRIVLSGILQHQVDEVVQAYSGEFGSIEVQLEGEWAAVSAVKQDCNTQ